MNPEYRNQSRWRVVKLCRTAERGPGKQSFKDAILDVCNIRKDAISNQIEVRLQGALSDLHAADARYHEDCKSKFMAP